MHLGPKALVPLGANRVREVGHRRLPFDMSSAQRHVRLKEGLERILALPELGVHEASSWLRRYVWMNRVSLQPTLASETGFLQSAL